MRIVKQRYNFFRNFQLHLAINRHPLLPIRLWTKLDSNNWGLRLSYSSSLSHSNTELLSNWSHCSLLSILVHRFIDITWLIYLLQRYLMSLSLILAFSNSKIDSTNTQQPLFDVSHCRFYLWFCCYFTIVTHQSKEWDQLGLLLIIKQWVKKGEYKNFYDRDSCQLKWWSH